MRKLKKAIYGLKQAPRIWFGKFCVTRVSHDEMSNESFILIHAGSKYVLLMVYVDDIILSGNGTQGIENLKHFLSTKFQIKYVGKLRYFLHTQVTRSVNGIILFLRGSIPLTYRKMQGYWGPNQFVLQCVRIYCEIFEYIVRMDPNQKLTN